MWPGSDSSHPGPVNITRVVGSGTASEFDSQGFLANWPAYTTNGILSEQAWLNFRGFTEGDNPPSAGIYNLTVYVNGQAEASVPINFLSSSTCVSISTRHLKFPMRGQDGALPVPAINQIALTSDLPSNEIPSLIFGSLTIHALAPIILVHGWNAGPWWWGDSPSTAQPCGIDKRFNTGKSTRDGGFGFIDPLVSGHYPFDCSIQINDVALSEQGGAELKKALLFCENELSTDNNFICSDGRPALGKLKEFGTKHVHLICDTY